MSPKPAENSERVSTYLSPEAVEALKIEAKAKGLNVSSLIRMILMEHISKK